MKIFKQFVDSYKKEPQAPQEDFVSKYNRGNIVIEEIKGEYQLFTKDENGKMMEQGNPNIEGDKEDLEDIDSSPDKEEELAASQKDQEIVDDEEIETQLRMEIQNCFAKYGVLKFAISFINKEHSLEQIYSCLEFINSLLEDPNEEVKNHNCLIIFLASKKVIQDLQKKQKEQQKH